MVSKSPLVVSWDKEAYASLQRIYMYIKQDSLVNAEKVKNGKLKITKSLSENPTKYPPDKFKSKNQGSYRAFEKYSYRAAYKHSKKEIKILRIRHVKQEPLAY
jgi:plasmid stabilization system protein ParE